MTEDHFEYTEHFGQKEVGYKFTAGPKFVTPAEIDIFCAITGSKVDHFLIDEAGQNLGIGVKGRILPGILTLAATGALLDHSGLAAPGLMVGMNNIKVLAPVSPYDRLMIEGEVLSKRVTSKGDRVLVTFSMNVKNQNGVTVLESETTELYPNPERA